PYGFDRTAERLAAVAHDHVLDQCPTHPAARHLGFDISQHHARESSIVLDDAVDILASLASGIPLDAAKLDALLEDVRGTHGARPHRPAADVHPVHDDGNECNGTGAIVVERRR